MSGAISTLVRGGLFGATASATGVAVLKGSESSEGLLGVASFINGLIPTGRGMSNYNANTELVNMISAQNDRIGDLSLQMSRMQLYGSSQGRGLGFLFSWSGIVVIGGTCYVLYHFGFTPSDFMYVTKKTFYVAMESMQEGVEAVGLAVDIVKKELTYRLGLLEDQVEETRVSLEKKIETQVADVKLQVSQVGDDVKGVAQVQEEVQDMVQGLETQFKCLESKMEGATDQLGRANKGISLLCNAVVKEMEGGNNNNNNKKQSGARMSLNNLYDELINYTEAFDASISGTFVSSLSYFRAAKNTPSIKDKNNRSKMNTGLQQLLD